MTTRIQRRGGAKFVRYFGPILDALRELGGSGTPAEVANKIAENLNISEEEQTELLKSGTPRFANQVAWARNYLKLEGYIGSSKKGVWVLTEAGKKAHLSYEDAHKIFLKWVAIHQESRQQKQQLPSQDEVVDSLNEEAYQDYQEELLSILKQLPATGFENLCQRLLRDYGFDPVIVTGRSGDGGIDGHGVLKINPFVTFKVHFQCKKFNKYVSPSYIREFQGAITGRADKGLIITTGTFSTQAKAEAVRDGAPKVELIDGQKLITLFEELELGLKPKKTYEIDYSFFETFKGRGRNNS